MNNNRSSTSFESSEKTPNASSHFSECPDDPSPHAFCPVGGLQGDSSLHFNKELLSLLAFRLYAATWLLFGGFLAFFIRSLLSGDWALPAGPQIMIAEIIVITILAAMLAWLGFRRRNPAQNDSIKNDAAQRSFSLKQLRVIEVAVFGVPALFFVWIQFCRVCHCPAERITELAASFPAETSISWIILIQIYGLFIPNSWKRATTVISIMALLPVIGAILSGLQSEPVARSLYEQGGLSAMILRLIIVSLATIYGSHRFGRLRREAFDARHIGSYTLREKLGSGGMGDVYIADHQLLKRRCAIKLIKPEKAGDPNALARFESEVQAAAQLTHPNTIEIFDYGHTQDRTFYYVMEYLPGLNLQEIVEQYGPLPSGRVIHLLTQVCSALQESHATGLIHRDIKPGNIFAAERGGIYDVAKLLDFGLVKSLPIGTNKNADDIKLTLDGTVVGSPLFAAPETILDEQLSPGSDIYSLGATAYFLLTGKPVFHGENPLKVLFAHANETPPPLSQHNKNIPANLEAVIMKCLEKKPKNRYPNVSELEKALQACRPETTKWSSTEAKKWWQQTTATESSNSNPTPEAIEKTIIATTYEPTND